MKKLYFVRHGMSEMNKAGLRSGHTDTPLVEEGIAQARLAGQAAKPLAIDVIVSSPLQRAHHTAKVIAEEIDYPIEDIILEDLLIERNFGELEGTDYIPGQPLSDVPGIETVEEITERARLVLERLRTLPHERVLVVSHGSFGRALRHHTDPSRPFQDVAHPTDRLRNATIIELL